ncbi:MAG TPA: sporulation integral membrane protein YtvI [Bacillota bacterium]|nr:sporulation integral membrane protein YtvI [Bacillota bacterium]
MRDFYKRHWNLIINLALLIATLLIAAVAFKLIVPYFLPFFLGLILALAMEPATNLFLRLKMPRVAATGAAMLVTVGSLTAVAWLAVSKIIVELTKFLANAPVYASNLKNNSLIMTQKLQQYAEGLPPEFAYHLNKNALMLSEMFSEKVSLTAGEILKLTANLPNQILTVIIALIATFFFSKDLPKIKSRVVSLIPAEMRHKLRTAADEIYDASIGFIKAQIILSAITCIVILAGLIILRTEYVVLISLLGGLLSPVPVLGVGVLFFPWIACSLLTGNTKLALGLSVLFAAVVIIKHSLEPKVLGENIGINPLSVLISLYVGYELCGAYGFVLGPFVLITYNALLKAKAFAWLFKNGPGNDRPADPGA